MAILVRTLRGDNQSFFRRGGNAAAGAGPSRTGAWLTGRVTRARQDRVLALLLRGASDGIVSAEYLARYARLLPQARIETIAAAGHLPHVEQPVITAASVVGFLQG